jgi:hypothetical protein
LVLLFWIKPTGSAKQPGTEEPPQGEKPLKPHFDRNSGSKLALDWRVLGILNLYRVLVPLVLVSLYSLGGGRGLAVESPRLFFAADVF